MKPQPTYIASWLLSFVLVVATCTAEPYIPTSDDEVLETLPRELLASQNELAPLRKRLATDPNNADLAGEVASRYLQMGKQQSDPRYFGYARAALRPWWDAGDAPPEILRLRAKLKESNHGYDDALDDLKLLLGQQPRDVQAWIDVANIRRVQGKYDESQAACDSLSEFAGSLQATFCRVPLQAVTGHAEQAYEELSELLPTARGQFPGAVPWVLTMQADIARALGRGEQAERHYREGLEADPENSYLLRTYADFLLDHDREQEVVALCREHLTDNGTLVRAAIAARRSGQTALADPWQAQLASSFDEIRLRGSEPSGRYESRYTLELKHDPNMALQLALANWEKQKEYRDHRNVLEAALAADNPAAAKPVLQFLAKHGTEDVDLEQLVKRLENK